MSILIIAEHDNVSLVGATLNTVTAAQQIGGDIDLLIAGNDCGTAAQAAAQITGVNRVLLADHASLEGQLAENVANLVVSIADNYSHVLSAATTFGKNFMPRAAALLDVSQISEISEVISADTFVRPVYAGNAMATVQSSDRIKLITVRITKFDAAAETGDRKSVV